jgi:hypothetical protein
MTSAIWKTIVTGTGPIGERRVREDVRRMLPPRETPVRAATDPLTRARGNAPSPAGSSEASSFPALR